MSEPWRPDDVTRGVDAGDAGLVLVVDGEVAALVELEGCRAAGQKRGDADGDERHIGRYGFVRATGDGNLHAVLGGGGLLDLGTGEDTDALLDE